MRRALRILATCSVLAAGLVLVSPTTSGALGPDAVGWWSQPLPIQDDSRTESASGAGEVAGEVIGQSAGAPVRFGAPGHVEQIPPPVTIPPPPVPIPTVPPPPITIPGSDEGTDNPTVPDGGLWVSNLPTGPRAVSAIRFRGDIGTGELTLTIAAGSTLTGPIVACPIISGWSPGPAGTWRDRPAIDCDTLSISGKPTPDGAALVFAVPQGFSTFGERVVDVGLRPAVGVGDPFDVYFEAPGPDSFEVFAGQSPPTTEAELPDPPPEALPTTMPTSPPATVAPVEVTTSTTAPEIDQTPVVDLGGDSGQGPQAVAEVFAPFTESRTSRIIAVTLLLLIGLGLWYLSGQQARSPRLLGALAGGETASLPVEPVDTGRGIGRFRRSRTGPPTRF